MSETIIPAPAAIPAGERKTANIPAIIFALALGAFAIGMTEFSAMSLLPSISQGLGVTQPVAAHLVSIYAIGVVVGAPTIAIACSRLSRRTLLIALMALFAAGNIASALVSSYEALLALRFISGLPHGAFLGVAALMAVSVVERRKRAQAVSYVLLGLTSSMIVGVSLATFIGQTFGWGWGFALPGALALASMSLIIAFIPRDIPDRKASPLRELGALRNRAIWLTLLTASIGFAGFFAVYAFTAATLIEVTGIDPSGLPWVFAVFGIGMSLGTVAAGWAGDRNLMATPAVFLTASALSLALFPFAAPRLWTIVPVIFLIGFSSAISGVLQTRLMDVAEGAQTAAAALNHSAFNLANAMGPWFAGLAITAGYGFASTGFVGAALAAGGLVVWLIAWHASHPRRKPLIA